MKNQVMKTYITTIILLLSTWATALSQGKPAYILLDSTGTNVDYEAMIHDLAQSDMVFFGEYHTNPISHWLQLEVSKSLHEIKGTSLKIGAEMLECGNQLVLDEYLRGLYPEKKMLPEVTQMWSNYKSDYRPLVEFAKEHQLRFIASNIPRRYASMISNMGMDALKELSPEALKLISPDFERLFDPTAKAYAEMADIMEGLDPTDLLYMQMAQASKDATMAHFTLKNYEEGDLFFHIQGSYHSNYDQGIIWWINKTRTGLKIKSITTVTKTEWEELSDEDKSSIADYIIVVADGLNPSW